MPEEHRQSEEIQLQQDASVHDAGDVEVEEVDADGYWYTHLGFLETCMQQGRQMLVDGKVSKINKEKKALMPCFLGQGVGVAGPHLQTVRIHKGVVYWGHGDLVQPLCTEKAVLQRTGGQDPEAGMEAGMGG